MRFQGSLACSLFECLTIRFSQNHCTASVHIFTFHTLAGALFACMEFSQIRKGSTKLEQISCSVFSFCSFVCCNSDNSFFYRCSWRKSLISSAVFFLATPAARHSNCSYEYFYFFYYAILFSILFYFLLLSLLPLY